MAARGIFLMVGEEDVPTKTLFWPKISQLLFLPLRPFLSKVMVVIETDREVITAFLKMTPIAFMTLIPYN
ncbi:MAG: hypothetical protein KIS77_04270 [Saprospiraceae bacterium]|nr:hypothetical protein [Saprospiraceae bacterium]